MSEDPLEHMRARIEQCRRLANALTDEKTSAMLRQMAEEGQRDLEKLEAERSRDQS